MKFPYLIRRKQVITIDQLLQWKWILRTPPEKWNCCHLFAVQHRCWVHIIYAITSMCLGNLLCWHNSEIGFKRVKFHHFPCEDSLRNWKNYLSNRKGGIPLITQTCCVETASDLSHMEIKSCFKELAIKLSWFKLQNVILYRTEYAGVITFNSAWHILFSLPGTHGQLPNLSSSALIWRTK